MSANISHGRGGAANIRPDDTPYTDGAIIREGPAGDQGDGPYSAGRGGAGNISKEASTRAEIGDAEYVPETAMREVKQENVHYGRGGAGNVIHEKPKEETITQYGFEKKVPHESVVDKVKHLFHKDS